MTGGLMQLLAYGSGGYDFLNKPNFTLNCNKWNCNVIGFEIPEDAKCSITLNKINIDDGVCKCNQCNNIFEYNAYKKWVENSETCPLCRYSNIEYTYYTHDGINISS